MFDQMSLSLGLGSGLSSTDNTDDESSDPSPLSMTHFLIVYFSLWRWFKFILCSRVLVPRVQVSELQRIMHLPPIKSVLISWVSCCISSTNWSTPVAPFHVYESLSPLVTRCSKRRQDGSASSFEVNYGKSYHSRLWTLHTPSPPIRIPVNDTSNTFTGKYNFDSDGNLKSLERWLWRRNCPSGNAR